MITINLKEAHEIIQAQQATTKPKLHITFGTRTTMPEPSNAPGAAPRKEACKEWCGMNYCDENGCVNRKRNAVEITEADKLLVDKSPVLGEKWSDYNQLRIEQAKEANKIHELIDAGAPAEDLAELYQRVESFRPDLINLYEQAKAPAKQAAPAAEKTSATLPEDLLTLKDRKQKLSDKRCKLKVKIRKGSAASSPKLKEWELELEKSDAEYKAVEAQILKAEGKL